MIALEAREDAGEVSNDASWPSRGLAWTAVALLALAAVVSQLDRIVISLLVEPIKAEFGLSDAGFGALTGIAFGVSYTLANLLSGWAADRYVRRTIIGGGLVVFSLFAVGTGLAKTYWQLFAARCGVGVGEASLFPAGFSIISDYFPPRRLGLALGVFIMSSMVGIGVAFLAGGALLEFVTHADTLRAALGGLSPWRLTIILVALPGLVLAPFLILLPEPRRRGQSAADAPDFAKLMQAIKARRVPFMLISLAMAFVTLVHYSMLAWVPALFARVYGLPAGEIGLRLGLTFLLFGTSGTVAAGWLSDALGRRGVHAAPLMVAGWAALGVGICGALAPLMPDANAATLLYVPYVFSVVMAYPCCAAALQMLFPNRVRAQASGLYLTVINLVGYGVGPALVGYFNDSIFVGPEGVRHSMAVVAGAGAAIILPVMFLAAKYYRPHLIEGQAARA